MTAWLKAGYLAVFSLLGTKGYEFARSRALIPIRRQILHPLATKNVGRFVTKPLSYQTDTEGDIILIANPVQCWVILVKDHVVVLPCSDTTPDEPLEELGRQNGGTIGGVWRFHSFGAVRSLGVRLQGAEKGPVLIGMTIVSVRRKTRKLLILQGVTVYF